MSQINKHLANAKRPCDCSCAVPMSEKFTVQHSILDMMSFGKLTVCAVLACHWYNNGVGQFKPIFQVEGNTFCAIFLVISSLIDCSTNLPLEVLAQRNFVQPFIRMKFNFIPKNWKIGFWATPWRT